MMINTEEIKAAEAMRDYARLMERSNNPDIVIAFANWEKRFIEELERLEKSARRAERKTAA